jgi:glutamate--cysteine ligase
LLADSPPDTPGEIAALGRNQHRVAARGREPGLLLEQGEEHTVLLTDWAAQLLAECGPIADALDAANGGGDYRAALQSALAALDQPDTLPSARVLATMASDFDSSYVAFIRAQSTSTRQALLALPWTAAQADRYAAMAAASVAEQQRIEAADSMPFEQYRQAYLSPDRLQVKQTAAIQA